MLNKEEKQTLIVIAGLMLLGIILYMFTHMTSCQKNDTPTHFDIPTGNVSVNIAQSDSIYIHISGAVNKPGVYKVPGGSRTFEAIQAAGGALAIADLDKVNLSKPLKDGEKIMVNTRTFSGTYRPKAINKSVQKKKNRTATPDNKVNINTASAEELDTLPGIGPALAERIVEYRDQHSMFSIEDLRKVKGISAKTLKNIREKVEF